MNRFLRMITTLMLAVGFVYIFLYTFKYMDVGLDALYQPSYFTVKSYRNLMISGALTVLITLIGSFFAWFRQLDTKKKELPNALGANADQIDGWLKDSTLRVVGNTAEGMEKTEIIDDKHEYVKTEIVQGDTVNEEYKETEILTGEDIISEK